MKTVEANSDETKRKQIVTRCVQGPDYWRCCCRRIGVLNVKQQWPTMHSFPTLESHVSLNQCLGDF
jgi:hypothetical protein